MTRRYVSEKGVECVGRGEGLGMPKPKGQPGITVLAPAAESLPFRFLPNRYLA